MLRQSALALLFVFPIWADKRPLTANDYDNWRHIQNQQLSNDGRYLAYAIFPQQGDGELVIRDLKTGKELRQPIGELPPPPPPNYANPQPENGPPAAPGIALKFTPDSSTVVFSTFAPHDAVEKAKREKPKPKPEDMPKGDVVIVRLASGAVFRAPRVKSFQVPALATGLVAYLQTHENAAAAKPVAAESSAQPAPSKLKKIETGDLILHNLNDSTERRFADISEYSLTNDGSTLVYAVAGGKPELMGLFALTTRSGNTPRLLLSGKGKYERLAWDEDQTRLAFVSDRDDSSAHQPRFSLYTWDRRSPTAVRIVSSQAPGIPAGWVISDKPTLTVAKGGDRIFFGTAPAPPPVKPPDSTPDDERVSVDLWSWKDDYIQPMQKVRASLEKSRSYGAVYIINGAKVMQLADQSMEDLLPSEDGRYAIGGDNRPYRRMQEYDASFTDSYVVDTTSGERKLVAPKHIGRVSWSPDSKYAVYYDGKNWQAIAASEARLINLTGRLGVSFGREDNDMPEPAESYRFAGWTKDGKYVLIYDRFDIWRVSPDGSSAENLTEGFGRKNHIIFRLVRFQRPDDPSSRWIDPAKPLLLRAESDETHDSGFYRTTIDASAPPRKLLFASKDFAPPIKAKNADVYVTAEAAFDEYPDLRVTDSTFRELNKVSNAYPGMAKFLWGTSEMIHFDSADGIPLKGVLYKPDNFDPSKKYPLIVYIYERLSENVHHFVEPRPYNRINESLYVSNGYLVLEPDIAYKVGYPGQSALNCVLPAIQTVVNRGFVNEAAIGIQGHSWGGYQIAYMVTRTNRFRAAAAGAPVADMISAYDGIRWGPGIPRQFQYEHTQSRIGGTVWQYPLRYIDNSPIFMADRVSTPLLMIHNDADDAVPWYQGIEYFLALRRLNKEAFLFSYNGEPHNLRKRADQKDYALRLQQFFDYYLKGAPKPDWMEHGIPYLDKPGVAVADSDDQ